MALLTCPDCGSSVSDQAFACQYCGRPVRAGEYTTADPSRTGADRPERPQSSASDSSPPPSPSEPVETESAPRPWVRYWARFIDTTIAIFGLAFVSGFLSPGAFADDESGWTLVFSALFVWIFVEAVMLSSWGTTPGKALLKVSVTRNGQDPPGFGTSLARSFRVWFFGLGIGFPVVTAITMLVAYNKLKKRGRTTWDRKLGLIVTHKEIGPLRWAVLVAILVGLFMLNVAASAGGM